MPFSYEKARQELLEERAKLREQLERLEAAEYESIGYSNHMADDATEAYEQAKELALHQNAKQLLAQVTVALDRFDQGTYGICERCRAEIDPARLKALPYATLCLQCQQRLRS